MIDEKTRRQISVQPAWALALPLQQQSVLLLACRGPDGVAKEHPCKTVHRAYRGCVLVAARYGRNLRLGERADTFMSLCELEDSGIWKDVIDRFLQHYDSLPGHYVRHLLHGAEILSYKHPDVLINRRWEDFYLTVCRDMHLNPETEAQMDGRLSDWGRRDWDEG